MELNAIKNEITTVDTTVSNTTMDNGTQVKLSYCTYMYYIYAYGNVGV